MKTKQMIVVAGIVTAGLLLELTVVAGEINVKKETGSADTQVVAPVAGTASAPDKFISMGIFEADAENAFATQIKLTGKQNLIESNVASVKFNFMVPKSAAGGATETAYREIDVVGKASEK